MLKTKKRTGVTHTHTHHTHTQPPTRRTHDDSNNNTRGDYHCLPIAAGAEQLAPGRNNTTRVDAGRLALSRAAVGRTRKDFHAFSSARHKTSPRAHRKKKEGSPPQSASKAEAEDEEEEKAAFTFGRGSHQRNDSGPKSWQKVCSQCVCVVVVVVRGWVGSARLAALWPPRMGFQRGCRHGVEKEKEEEEGGRVGGRGWGRNGIPECSSSRSAELEQASMKPAVHRHC